MVHAYFWQVREIVIEIVSFEKTDFVVETISSIAKPELKSI